MYKFISFLLIITFFASCASNKVVKVDEKDRIKKVEQFFDSIHKRRDKIKSITIEAKADTFNKGKRVRGKLMMSVTRPDNVRVDTLSPFEQPISTMLVSDNTLNFYNFDEKKLYTGKSNAKNLSLFLPIRISLKQFIDLFSGISPMIAYRNHSFKYIEKTAEYELILSNDNIKQRIVYTGSTLQIRTVEFYKESKKLFIIKFSNVKTSDGIKYAKKIYFEDFKTKSKLKLIITDIDFNKDVDKSIYQAIEWNHKVEELH